MITTEGKIITVSTKINAPEEKVWEYWTHPMHIIHWNYASDDWHTTMAQNNVIVGGKFNCRMEAKDGSFGFDFTGTYTKVERNKLIEETLDDGRKVQISFTKEGNSTLITESFEAEDTNPLEMQKDGWQAILGNFKKYVEASGKMDLLHFDVSIDANVEKVYQNMIDEDKWKEWTAEFNPESQFEGSWTKGSKMLFLGMDKDGKMGGMVARIKENIPNRFVSIEYNGVIQNGKEVTSGPEVDQWVGGLENYTFTDMNGKTLLSIDADANHSYHSYFMETWPKALKKLKSMCEG